VSHGASGLVPGLTPDLALRDTLRSDRGHRGATLDEPWPSP
jgi:hypothetical protein